MSEKSFFVYIITNPIHSTVYIGVTSDLSKRAFQHKDKFFDGFSKKYNTIKLVYYEQVSDAENAIMREKQLKRWNRAKKDNLVNQFNPA